MEKAAMAAYLKDVENNTMDMTAEKLIREKESQLEGSSFSSEIDPCDPISQPKTPVKPRVQGTHMSSGENKAHGKSKTGKGKGKKIQTKDSSSKSGVKKLWYEARTSEGYTYYWHIETNESIWEVPEEDFMTMEEQEQEIKEQKIQEQFLQQLKEEEDEKNAGLLEEQRANAEREKLKELRKKEVKIENKSNDEDKILYRRDYSVPEKPEPYGAWQPIQKIEHKPVDLQLPERKQIAYVPSLQSTDPPPSQKVFKEKTITHISTGDSDNEGSHFTFKKRKLGNKNVRKRLMDD